MEVIATSVKLYTIGCPQCKVLERKLGDAKIRYDTETDVEEMKKMGISTLPILEVDGERLTFAKAIEWVREREKR